ncbi:MAG: 50S ribosomal protein L4 [Patescibacteria group bacterium]|nr:50S ribosomal protein L4 [Patescibacteria group bacterium]
MKVKVYNLNSDAAVETELSEKIFKVAPSASLIHQAVVAEMANTRNTVAHTKTRGEVRGGGKKPWKQKGTGRARAGSIRSPIWKGGGVTFGPRSNRNFKQSLNRSQFRKGLFSVLSQKLSAKKLFVIEDFKLSAIKTKEFRAQIVKIREGLKLPEGAINLVISGRDHTLEYSARNLPEVTVLRVAQITPYLLLKQPVTLIFKSALPVIEKTFSK